MRQISAWLLLAITILAGGATSSRAADDVLSQIPSNALGFVVVHRLDQTGQKADAMAQLIEAPLPNLLDALRGAIGVNEGLDVTGHAMVVLAPLPEGQPPAAPGMPFIPMGFIPVSNYAQFLAPLEGDKSRDIAEVRIAGEAVLVTQKGTFAVFVDDDHRAALMALREAPAQPPAEVTTMHDWLVAQDAAAVILPPGIAMLSEQAAAGIRGAQESLRAEAAEIPQLAQAIAGFDMYLKLLEEAGQQISAIAAAFRIDDGQNVHFASKWLARPESGFAMMAAGRVPAEGSLVGGIPAGPFVFAGGLAVSPSALEFMTNWGIAMMRSSPELLGRGELSEEDATRLKEATAKSYEGVKSVAIFMRPGEGNDSVFSHLGGVYQVENAAESINRYEEVMKTWNDILGEATGPISMKSELERTQVAGVEALKITIDLGGPLNQAAAPPEIQQLIRQLVGQDGKMVAVIAPANETTVVLSYGGEEGAARMLDQARAGGPKLDADAGVAQTSGMVPQGAQGIGFISVQGVISFARRMVDMIAGPGAITIPPFSELAPPVAMAIKYDADGAVTECVIPLDLIKLGKAYADVVMQMN
jgi:hypothetical protein